MAIGSAFKRRPVGASPVGAALRLPTDFDQLTSSAHDNAMANNRIASEMAGIRSIQDRDYEAILVAEKERDPSFQRSSIMQDAVKYYGGVGDKSKPNALSRPVQNDTEARYAAMVDKFGIENVPLYADTEAAAAMAAQQTFEQFQEDLQYTMSASPKMATFFGEMYAAVKDPAQVAAMVASLPMGVSSSIVKTAAIEGAVNLGIDIPVFAHQRQWYKKQGRELTNEEIAQGLMFSFIFGSAIGGGVSAFARWADPNLGTSIIQGPRANTLRDLRLNGDDVHPDWLSSKDMAYLDDEYLEDLARLNINSDASTGPYSGDTYSYKASDYDETKALEDSPESPWRQTTDRGVVSWLSESLFDATQILDPGVRQAGLNELDLSRHASNNPGRMASTNYDTMAMRYSYGEISAAHQKNIQDAVLALERGEMPTATQTRALTVGMTIDDSAARMGELRDLVSGKVTLSMKSAPYRQYLTAKIIEIMRPRLMDIVDDMAHLFPEDRIPLKNSVKKPSRSAEDLADANAKLETDGVALGKERKKLVTEQTKSDVWAKAAQRASDKGEAIPKKYKGFRLSAAIRKDIEKLDAKIKKLDEKIAANNNGGRQWIDFQAERDRIAGINEGMKMEKELSDLDDGILSTRLKALRARLDEQYQTIKGAPALRREALSEGATEAMDYVMRKGKFGSGMDDTAMALASIPRKSAAAATEFKALELEVKSLDGDTIVTFQGEDGAMISRSLNDELNYGETKMVNAVAEANFACGIGGKPVE